MVRFAVMVIVVGLMSPANMKCACVRVQCKEDEVMSRIRNAEHSQLVEAMRRRVAELEIEVNQHTCILDSQRLVIALIS